MVIDVPYSVVLTLLYRSDSRLEHTHKKHTHDMNKYQKYVKACEFVSTVKAHILANGVTVTPYSDEVVVSHKDFGHLGGGCSTALGMKRLINKTAKEAATALSMGHTMNYIPTELIPELSI
jgi:hypothetical protein